MKKEDPATKEKGIAQFMIRRILAWVTLIFFLLLLMNILIFKILIAESAMLYGLMVALFLLTKTSERGRNDYDSDHQEEEEEEPAEEQPDSGK